MRANLYYVNTENNYGCAYDGNRSVMFLHQTMNPYVIIADAIKVKRQSKLQVMTSMNADKKELEHRIH